MFSKAFKGCGVEKEILDKLYMIMDYSNEGVVPHEVYMHIMGAWSSFAATDINGDNELDIDELKTLIWIMEGKEPDEKRVLNDMKLIDADGGGTIDRLEWISYLVSPAGEGSDYFDFSIKKSFDAVDRNKTGMIDCDQFNIVLIDRFKDQIRKLDGEMKEHAEGIVE